MGTHAQTTRRVLRAAPVVDDRRRKGFGVGEDDFERHVECFSGASREVALTETKNGDVMIRKGMNPLMIVRRDLLSKG